MKYTFTYIIDIDEDGYYVADVQELPGVILKQKVWMN